MKAQSHHAVERKDVISSSSLERGNEAISIECDAIVRVELLVRDHVNLHTGAELVSRLSELVEMQRESRKKSNKTRSIQDNDAHSKSRSD